MSKLIIGPESIKMISFELQQIFPSSIALMPTCRQALAKCDANEAELLQKLEVMNTHDDKHS